LAVSEFLHLVVGAMDRKAIDNIAPVYKSVQLTSGYLNSLQHRIDKIANSDPSLIVINDSPRRLGLASNAGVVEYNKPTRCHLATISIRSRVTLPR
jgi:hypothetical protein